MLGQEMRSRLKHGPLLVTAICGILLDRLSVERVTDPGTVKSILTLLH